MRVAFSPHLNPLPSRGEETESAYFQGNGLLTQERHEDRMSSVGLRRISFLVLEHIEPS